MGQLCLFGRAEITAMRDRTAARNYSPAGDAFRREHERHRAWGLQRRHADKLRRLRQGGATPPTGSVVVPVRTSESVVRAAAASPRSVRAVESVVRAAA